MRCDLRRTGAFDALLFEEVGLNLLTSGAGSIHVLTCVAGDFRLATLAPFDLVALTFEAERQL